MGCIYLRTVAPVFAARASVASHPINDPMHSMFIPVATRHKTRRSFSTSCLPTVLRPRASNRTYYNTREPGRYRVGWHMEVGPRAGQTRPGQGDPAPAALGRASHAEVANLLSRQLYVIHIVIYKACIRIVVQKKVVGLFQWLILQMQMCKRIGVHRALEAHPLPPHRRPPPEAFKSRNV